MIFFVGHRRQQSETAHASVCDHWGMSVVFFHNSALGRSLPFVAQLCSLIKWSTPFVLVVSFPFLRSAFPQSLSGCPASTHQRPGHLHISPIDKKNLHCSEISFQLHQAAFVPVVDFLAGTGYATTIALTTQCALQADMWFSTQK